MKPRHLQEGSLEAGIGREGLFASSHRQGGAVERDVASRSSRSARSRGLARAPAKAHRPATGGV